MYFDFWTNDKPGDAVYQGIRFGVKAMITAPIHGWFIGNILALQRGIYGTPLGKSLRNKLFGAITGVGVLYGGTLCATVYLRQKDDLVQRAALGGLFGSSLGFMTKTFGIGFMGSLAGAGLSMLQMVLNDAVYNPPEIDVSPIFSHHLKIEKMK